MEASQTPNAAPESLVLNGLFQSRSSLLQYLSGRLDADGSICIACKGGQQLVARVMFAQSNLAFLTAIIAEFDYTGSIYTKAAVDYNEYLWKVFQRRTAADAEL